MAENLSIPDKIETLVEKTEREKAEAIDLSHALQRINRIYDEIIDIKQRLDHELDKLATRMK
jgi:hypothetical protein